MRRLRLNCFVRRQRRPDRQGTSARNIRLGQAQGQIRRDNAHGKESRDSKKETGSQGSKQESREKGAGIHRQAAWPRPRSRWRLAACYACAEAGPLAGSACWDAFVAHADEEAADADLLQVVHPVQREVLLPLVAERDDHRVVDGVRAHERRHRALAVGAALAGQVCWRRC